MPYNIWSVKNYKNKDMFGDNFLHWLEKNKIDFDDLDELCEELENDNYYHFRINKDEKYIVFGDIDGYEEGIENFMKLFFDFMKKRYDLENQEYYYTINTEKKGSYHFSIPSWNATIIKLKEIFMNFKNESIDKELKEVIDTSIYSNHWFRCPNQSKGSGETKGIHLIKTGKIKNFIVKFIPKKSISLDDYEYIKEEVKNEMKDEKEKYNENREKIKSTNNDENKIEYNEKIREKKIEIIKQILNFYTKEYYDIYDNWYKIGMALKKLSLKYNYDFKKDYIKFSKKSEKYDEKYLNNMWNNFDISKITINEASLYRYARICDVGEWKLLMRELYAIQKIEITEKYIVETLKELLGENFIYVNEGDDINQCLVLYCFNIRNKLWYSGDTLLKKYINDELYDYLFNLVNDSITDKTEFDKQIKELKNYCLKVKGQEILSKAYQIRNKDETHKKVIFNENKNLFGFSNGVYDLLKNEFRDYKYDDYVSLNTGYEYEKGKQEEINELDEVFKKIMPDNDKKYLLMQILASGLIGKQYQNFFLFNGAGGNGKSTISGLMKTMMGNYYGKLDPTFLVENKKTGASPEFANLSYKRYIVCSEPSEGKKIKNNIYKCLTGDKTIQARQCYSNKSQVSMTATVILECNKRPILEEEATDADSRRIIDLLFSSKFTTKEDIIDETKHIYKANKKYEETEYFEKVKYSFFEMLVKYSNKFLTEEKEEFKIPDSVMERSKEYLNSSYKYLDYLKELTEKTDEQHFISISEIFKRIKTSDLYINSSKEERKKINLKSIIEFFETNNETRNKYKNSYRPYIDGVQKFHTNVLLGYKFISNDEDY